MLALLSAIAPIVHDYLPRIGSRWCGWAWFGRGLPKLLRIFDENPNQPSFLPRRAPASFLDRPDLLFVWLLEPTGPAQSDPRVRTPRPEACRNASTDPEKQNARSTRSGS